jgi:hypothetical protein
VSRKGRGRDRVSVSDVPVWDVCASTARRLEEIAARNRIRKQAGLPILSNPKELRKMKKVDDAAEFDEFADRHRQAVWDEVLGPARRGKPRGTHIGFQPD